MDSSVFQERLYLNLHYANKGVSPVSMYSSDLRSIHVAQSLGELDAEKLIYRGGGTTIQAPWDRGRRYDIQAGQTITVDATDDVFGSTQEDGDSHLLRSGRYFVRIVDNVEISSLGSDSDMRRESITSNAVVLDIPTEPMPRDCGAR